MSDKTSDIAIYERVSSTQQDTKSQHHELEKWAGDKPVKWYKDKFTGKTTDRPGLNKLLLDIRAGKIKTVVVWRLDRLGRTALGLHRLFEEFLARGINFVSVRDGIDLSTPTGRMMASILASVAVYETEVRGERIKAGLDAKRERVKAGKEVWNMGRPAGSVVKTTPEVREHVYRMKDANDPVAEIARVLKLSRQTVYTILKERPKVR